MTWQLPAEPHQQFAKNTIESTIAQLRYHPILRVKEIVPLFQERVRSRFPAFRISKTQEVSLEPGGVRVEPHEEYRFATADGGAAISLGVQGISLSNRRHTNHREFIADFQIGVDALRELCEPINAFRLGLRYINVLRKEQISIDLGKPVDWDTLVQKRFLALPEGVVNRDGTLFASEITSSLSPGLMTVRHGLIKLPSDANPHFRFDVDRFSDGKIDVPESGRLLQSFADGIYAVFASFAGEDLYQWMRRPS